MEVYIWKCSVTEDQTVERSKEESRRNGEAHFLYSPHSGLLLFRLRSVGLRGNSKSLIPLGCDRNTLSVLCCRLTTEEINGKAGWRNRLPLPFFLVKAKVTT